jgi:rifampicin phosphotransferase
MPWRLETSHNPGSPTGLYRSVFPRLIRDGTARGFGRYGLPFESLMLRVIHERFYWCVAPAPAETTANREQRASMALAQQAWRKDAYQWSREKQRYVTANRTLQAEPIDRYPPHSVATYLEQAIINFERGAVRHFELTVTAGLPVGLLLMWAAEHDVDTPTAVRLLAGASPASRAELNTFSQIAGATENDPPPATLDQLFAGDGQAGRLLADYLRDHQWHLVSGHDFDSITLGEQPDLLLSAILATRDRRAIPDVGASEAWQELAVPRATRGTLTELVRDARQGYGLRDDNVRILAMWSGGIVRRAVLETGRRLGERLAAPEHAFELTLSEATTMLRGGVGPSPQRVAERRQRRDESLLITPPEDLGATPGNAVPPSWTGAVRALAQAWIAYTSLWDDQPRVDELHGTGIGTGTYTGRARVSPNGAVAALIPGEVLVTTVLTPDHAAIMPAVGGLVVDRGGIFSHAAIIAREYGIPAVIGARGATRAIRDGDLIEVDGRTGKIVILKRISA